MKATATVVIAAALLATTSVLAAHEEHAAEGKEVARAADAAPCPPARQAQIDVMLSNLKIQAEAIRETDDPKERRRLLRNHLDMMQETLDLMAPREGNTREGSRPDAKPAKDKGTGMMHNAPMHRELEQRVDRLQKLLEQLIEHEQAERGDEQG